MTNYKSLSPEDEKRGKGCLLFVLIVIVGFIIYTCSGDTKVSESEAWIIAKDYVESNLKAPSTADFSGEYSFKKEGENTFTIVSAVDAENVFGAKLRKPWRVKLTYNGGEWTDKNNWTLLDIEIY
jgi:hypothetical protein